LAGGKPSVGKVVVRVAFHAHQSHALPRHVFGDAEGTGAHGLELAKVGPGHAVVFLAIVILHGLAGDRRRAMHRQPIQDLRIRLAEVQPEGALIEQLDARQLLRVVVELAALLRRIVRFLQAGDVLDEVREKRRLHLRIAHPLEGEMHILGEHRAALAAGETLIVVKARRWLDPAEVADLSLRAHFLLRDFFQHARPHLVRVRLHRVILEQRVVNRLEDAPAHLVIHLLRIKLAWVLAQPAEAHQPGRTVRALFAKGRRVGIVVAAGEK